MASISIQSANLSRVINISQSTLGDGEATTTAINEPNYSAELGFANGWFTYADRFLPILLNSNLDTNVSVFPVTSLFVCGISLTSGQLINELFPDITRSCFSQVVLPRRGSDHIYEMRCLFVAVGPNARFMVLPHWDNMS